MIIIQRINLFGGWGGKVLLSQHQLKHLKNQWQNLD